MVSRHYDDLAAITAQKAPCKSAKKVIGNKILSTHYILPIGLPNACALDQIPTHYNRIGRWDCRCFATIPIAVSQ